jgi:hypothetical protein
MTIAVIGVGGTLIASAIGQIAQWIDAGRQRTWAKGDLQFLMGAGACGQVVRSQANRPWRLSG